MQKQMSVMNLPNMDINFEQKHFENIIKEQDQKIKQLEQRVKTKDEEILGYTYQSQTISNL